MGKRPVWDDICSMARERGPSAFAAVSDAHSALPALSGVEPRDERNVRIWAAIAMWTGGAATIWVGSMLPGGTKHADQLHGLALVCLAAAVFTVVVFPRVSNRALYLLTNGFSTLGAIVVWLACLWSGGASSGFAELYFFPVLYDAYFFRTRHMVAHLVLNSALALSPLLYDSALAGTQFPGRSLILVAGFWGMSAVVAHRKRCLLGAELESRRRALSDPLTGLHNRRSLQDRAARQELGQGSAVIAMDIDDFKAINSEYGHLGADELLRQVGLGLVAAVGDERDCVARVGGDEFVVLANEKSRDEIQSIARRCGLAIEDARARAGFEGSDLSGSVGYAIWPEDGQTFAELLAAADADMYKAKHAKTADAIDVAAAGGLEPDVQAGIAALASSELAAADPATGDPAPAETGARAERVGDAEPQIAGPPPRLVGESTPPQPRERGLRRAWVRASGRFTSKALVASACWLGGALITLLVVALPDADTSHGSLIVALICVAEACGLLVLVSAPRFGERVYVVSDLVVIPCVALGVYATGGTTSPLLPLVLVVVVFAAYFLNSGAIFRFAGAVLVCATPFAYTAGDASLEFMVRFVVLVTAAAVILAIILYGKHELSTAERTARELASHDPLTGLPNRRAFRTQATSVLSAAGTEPEPLVTVAMIDVDNLKRVNDRHGHEAGDALLQAIAQALSAVTRPEDCLARIGGDEFALVAREADASASRTLGARCVEAIEAAVAQTGRQDCEVSGTVGYALHPHHGSTLDELLHAADSALMQAKRRGKRGVGRAGGGSQIAS